MSINGIVRTIASTALSSMIVFPFEASAIPRDPAATPVHQDLLGSLLLLGLVALASVAAAISVRMLRRSL
jgi:hypothetical protein